jgi:hypothetical protein
MDNPDWDRRLADMASNRWLIGLIALTQVVQLAKRISAGGEVGEILVMHWLLPLIVTLSVAVAVSLWGWRHFWSLTRTTLFGVACVMLVHPMASLYVRLLVQPR